MTDQDRFEVNRNVATNGRLFCCMLFVLCLSAWETKQGCGFFFGALLSSLCVGLSCITEQLPLGALRQRLVAVVYGLPVIVALIVLLNIIIQLIG